MTEKTKHEFVDDNPYLVYSGDINTSYNADSGSGGGDGGGGGGGGDAGDNGIFYVTITSETPMDDWSNDEQNPTAVSSDKSYTEIIQAIEDGKIVIAKSPLYDVQTSENMAFLSLVNYGENTDIGTKYITFNLILENSSSFDVYHVIFRSSTVSDIVFGFMRTHSFT